MWVPRSTTRTARRRAGDTPTCGCPILFAYFLRKTTAPESRLFRGVILSEERSDESKDPFRCDETHMACHLLSDLQRTMTRGLSRVAAKGRHMELPNPGASSDSHRQLTTDN